MGNEPSRQEIAEEKRRERVWEEQREERRQREEALVFEREMQRQQQHRKQYERDQQRGSFIISHESFNRTIFSFSTRDFAYECCSRNH